MRWKSHKLYKYIEISKSIEQNPSWETNNNATGHKILKL
jgi:hypothetical protein